MAIHIQCSQTFAIPNARSRDVQNPLAVFDNHHAEIYKKYQVINLLT